MAGLPLLLFPSPYPTRAPRVLRDMLHVYRGRHLNSWALFLVYRFHPLPCSLPLRSVSPSLSTAEYIVLMLVDSVPMLRSWLTFSCKMLLLLFGVQLSIAAFFLLPSYIEYARDTQHLGVDLHHILIGDRFTNVAAVFCVFYPIPVLCSIGSAYDTRPFNDSAPDTVATSICGCLIDTLVGQQVFFGQLGYAIPPRETTMEFLVASALSSAASQAARNVATSESQSELYTEVATTLDRVDAALDVARLSVNKVVGDAEFAVYRYVRPTLAAKRS